MNPIKRAAGISIGIGLIIMAGAAFWSVGTLLGPYEAAGSNERFQLLFDNYGSFDAHKQAWSVIALLDVWISIAIILYYHLTNSTRAVLTGGVRIIYTIILFIAISSLELGFDQFYPDITMGQFGKVNTLLEEFYTIWNVGLIAFGVHLILWGRLITKPNILERILQVLLFIAGAGYIVTSGGPFLSDSYADHAEMIQNIFMIPMVLGELGMGIVIMIKSIRGRDVPMPAVKPQPLSNM